MPITYANDTITWGGVIGFSADTSYTTTATGGSGGGWTPIGYSGFTYATGGSTSAYDWGGTLIYTLQDAYSMTFTSITDSDIFPAVASPAELSEEDQALHDWLSAEHEWVMTWIRAERNWQAAERDRIRTAAEAKASELLLSMLPEKQKERYRLTGQFEVIGSHGGHYRIRRGVAGNIDWLDTAGRVGGSLCCHPPTWGEHWVPTPDVMLAQMLALQCDEPDFLRVANVSNGGRPPVVV